MMKTITNPTQSEWELLCRRPVLEKSDLDARVREILQNVREKGDEALRFYSEKFDKISLPVIRVPHKDLIASEKKVPSEIRKSIIKAKDNIERFHSSQIHMEDVVETTPGVKCWRKNIPIENVGLYVPGGTAPLFSTVLMLAIPAKIAGCRRIVMCTPPERNGNVNPLILFCAEITGVTDIFLSGGAQAIAAMAYGTESIPQVSKIFGPGNQYVTKAKEIVQSEGTAIDMPAGPSEVLVIADSEANPSFVASDLLSQAEHGTDSQVVLVTSSKDLIPEVMLEINRQIKELPRRELAEGALKNSLIIHFPSMEHCIDFSNKYAPEHLIINTADAGSLAEKIVNAGSVFIGKYSCESAGDYASGTNHTLPTNGFAVNSGGVSTESFLKKITFQSIDERGIAELGPVISILAEAESLYGHKNSVELRLKSIKNV